MLMGDDRDKPDEPKEIPLSETLERSKQRVRRSQTLLGWIDQLLGKRGTVEPPKEDGS